MKFPSSPSFPPPPPPKKKKIKMHIYIYEICLGATNKLENEFLITVWAVSTFKFILLKLWGMWREHIHNSKIFILCFSGIWKII